MDIAQFVDMLESHVGDWHAQVVLDYEGKELVVESDLLTGAWMNTVLTLHLKDKES